MNQNINLKEIERKAWTSYFQDGLFDIFLSIFMLTMAIRALTDNVWFIFMVLVAVLVVPLGKRFITIPRIGLVKFGPARKARLWKLRAVGGIAFLAMLVVLLLILSGSNLPSKEIRAAIQGIGLTLLFCLMAYFWDFRRLYVYGMFYAIGMVLWEMLGDPVGPIAFLVSGSVTLLIGIALFVSFLRKYPKPKEEVYNVK